MKLEIESIEWKESMATGIEDIDRQHQFLFDTLQQANRDLLGNPDALVLTEVAKLLLGYALTHFETEEALMNRYGYAEAFPEDAETHISQHRSFSRKVVSIIDQLHEGKDVSHIEVLQFLNNWLKGHVLGVDKQLGGFLNEQETTDKK